MKSKKYAMFGYSFYLLTYLTLVLISVKIHGSEFNPQDFIDIATFILLPVLICLVIGTCIWVFKRANFLQYSLVSMAFISPVGAAINLFAAYLLWWSANNA